MKKLKTTKLFYEKYPYKLTTRFKCGYLLRIYGYDGFRRLFKNIETVHLAGTYFNKTDVFRYLDIIQPYVKSKEIQVRFEGSNGSIFTKDENLFKLLQVELFYCLTSITEPENENTLNTMLDSKKTKLVDRYPHGLYRYKITFKKLTPNLKQTLLNWYNTYSKDVLRFNNSTIKNLHSPTFRYWDTNYVYLADSKMLTMLHLIASNNIRKIEHYVLNSSINTISQNQVYETMDG